ncbi:hypothetical protein BGX33_008914 [Mortierella sp. NVP41]|nr:hypothetical protein BGX33_008914 [Mortierella sp. NVP41]
MSTTSNFTRPQHQVPDEFLRAAEALHAMCGEVKPRPDGILSRKLKLGNRVTFAGRPSNHHNHISDPNAPSPVQGAALNVMLENPLPNSLPKGLATRSLKDSATRSLKDLAVILLSRIGLLVVVLAVATTWVMECECYLMVLVEACVQFAWSMLLVALVLGLMAKMMLRSRSN